MADRGPCSTREQLWQTRVVCDRARPLITLLGPFGIRRYECAFLQVEPVTREFGFSRRNAFTQPHLEQALLHGLARFQEVRLLFQHTLESLDEEAER